MHVHVCENKVLHVLLGSEFNCHFCMVQYVGLAFCKYAHTYQIILLYHILLISSYNGYH